MEELLQELKSKLNTEKTLQLIDAIMCKYIQLYKNELWVCALEAAGVDNWEGYDIAQDYYSDYLKENGLEED